MGPAPMGWTITDEGTFFQATTTSVIIDGGSRVTFTGTFATIMGTSGIANLTMTVIGGSGGELITSNNFDRTQVLVN